MKLASVVRSFTWRLDEGRTYTTVNPPVGTIVQFQEYYHEVVVYFPGYVTGADMPRYVFNLHFRALE